MKTSRRMDGHTFSVYHWLYAKDGRPLHVDSERDPTLPTAEEFSADHAHLDFDVTAVREVVNAVTGIFGPWCEVSFVSRGKIGSGTDLLLTDAGIWLSRLLQERHPQTGADLWPKEDKSATVQIPALVAANLGCWLSAAMSDSNVCQEMKSDINSFFEALAQQGFLP